MLSCYLCFSALKAILQGQKPHFSGVSHHTSSVNNAANLSHAFWQAKSLKPNRTASHLPKSHRERTLLFIINIISQHTPCPLFAYGAGPDATDCSEIYKLEQVVRGAPHSRSMVGPHERDGTRLLTDGCSSDCRNARSMVKSVLGGIRASGASAREGSDPS